MGRSVSRSIRRVAIVVPTPDTEGPHAAKCLRHVAQTTGHLDVSVHPIVESGPGFRFSRSINRGIAEASSADAWVLLNDDAFMDAGWLDAMLATTAAHPEAGVVGAVLRYPQGGIQFAGGRIPLTPLEYVAAATAHRAPLWALRNLARHRFAPRAYMFDHYRRVDARHRLDFITGACYLLTRECHERVGGFDERYAFGAEDVDHSLRTLEAGMELALATGATGEHVDGGSGQHMSPRQLESIEAFHKEWDGARLRAATRKDGRRGIHHTGGAS